MKKEEYIKKIEDLEKEFEIKKSKLAKEFALSNNGINIGDIITSDVLTCAIKVENIQIGLSSHVGSEAIPCCVYSGRTYLKCGSRPTKNESTMYIWQHQVSEVLRRADDE